MTRDVINSWIDRYRIPVTVTIVLTLQTMGTVAYISTWAAKTDGQLSRLNELLLIVDTNSDRISRIEAGESEEDGRLDRMTNMLNTLINMHLHNENPK